MGNKVALETKVTYQVISKVGDITISYKDLKGKNKYEKLPRKESEVQSRFKAFLQEVLLSPPDKVFLDQLPLKYKWRILLRHEEESRSLHDISALSTASDEKSELQIQLEKCLEKATPVSIQNLTRYLQHEAQPEEWAEFYQTRGTFKILQTLEQYEINARTSKNYMVCISFLKFLLFLMETEDGAEQIARVPNAFKTIFFNFHPIHIEPTSLVLEILGGDLGYIWLNDNYVDYILDAFSKYKQEYGYKYRFEPLLKTLYQSDNVMMVLNILVFLRSLLSSILDKNRRHMLKSELENTIIQGQTFENILDAVSKRVQDEAYKIEDSTFETVSKKLMKFKDPLTSMESMSRFSKETAQLQPVKPSKLMQQFQQAPKKEEKKHEEETHSHDQSQHGEQSSEVNNQKLYLENHDLQLMEEHLQTIAKMIDEIRNIDDSVGDNTEEESKAPLAPGEIPPEKFVDNADELFNKLKEQALKDDSFDVFLRVMNKFMLLPQNEQSQDTWKLLDEVITNMITGNFSNQPEKKKAKKESQGGGNVEELESQLAKASQAIRDLEKNSKKFEEELKVMVEQRNAKDKDLAEVQEERKKIKLEFDEFKNAKNSELAQLHNKLNGINAEHKKALEDKDKAATDLKNKVAELEKKIASAPVGGSAPPPPPPGSTAPPPPPPPGAPAPPPPPGSTAPPPPPPPGSTAPPPPPPPGGARPPPPPPPGGAPMPPPPPGGAPPPPPPPGAPRPPGAPPGPPPPPGAPRPPGGPPPPPGGAPAQPAGKFKHNPKVPMKNVMWNMVPQNNIKDTIWSKIDDLKVAIDKEHLEKEFAKPAATAAKPAAGGAPVKVEAVKVNLLGPERSKNFELVLGKLKMGYDKIAEALITIDDKILTLTNLESLEIIAPTDEEVSTIKGYDGDKSLLGNAEKFIDEIHKVKGFLNRIKGMRFSKVNDELFADLEPKVAELLATFDEIGKDTRIKDVLEYALAVGNYLNGTTPRGGAWGFKFENLDKLADVKTLDNKQNLLQYVITQVEKKHGKPLITSEAELEKYDKISKLPVGQLGVDLNEIKKGLMTIKKAIESQTPDPKDKITERLQKVYDRINERLTQLDARIKEAEETYKVTAKFLCENPADQSDKFGEKVLKFWRTIWKNKKDLEKIEETARKEAEKALKASQAPVKPATGGIPPKAGGLPVPGGFKLPAPTVGVTGGAEKPAPGPGMGFKLPTPAPGGFKLPTPGAADQKAPGMSLIGGGAQNIQAMRNRKATTQRKSVFGAGMALGEGNQGLLAKIQQQQQEKAPQS